MGAPSMTTGNYETCGRAETNVTKRVDHGSPSAGSRPRNPSTQEAIAKELNHENTKARKRRTHLDGTPAFSAFRVFVIQKSSRLAKILTGNSTNDTNRKSGQLFSFVSFV
jgi:hypothetical protein